MLEQQLKQLGLGEYEAAIYGVLLEHSPVGASFVAKRLGLSRSSVYTALSSLIAKGIVGATYKNEVKQFVIEGVDALDEYVRSEEERLKARRKTLDEIREQVRTLQRPDLHVPRILFFEGETGVKKMYWQLVREASPGAIWRAIRSPFVWDPKWSFLLDERWQNKRREKHITARLLVNDDPRERGSLGKYRKLYSLAVRVLPRAWNLKDFALNVLEDTVTIISLEHNNLVGVKMVNRHIAENMRQLFDAVWQASRATR